MTGDRVGLDGVGDATCVWMVGVGNDLVVAQCGGVHDAGPTLTVHRVRRHSCVLCGALPVCSAVCGVVSSQVSLEQFIAMWTVLRERW